MQMPSGGYESRAMACQNRSCFFIICPQKWTACIVTSPDSHLAGGLSNKKARAYFWTLQVHKQVKEGQSSTIIPLFCRWGIFIKQTCSMNAAFWSELFLKSCKWEEEWTMPHPQHVIVKLLKPPNINQKPNFWQSLALIWCTTLKK